MLKVQLAVYVVGFALWVYCLVDAVGSREGEVRNLPKLAWVVVVLLFPFVGSIAWLVAGRPERRTTTRHAPAAYPEYDRPGRMAAADTGADEAFLRGVRERAEAQRRAYELQQREARVREEQERERRARARAEREDPDAG